MTPIQAYRLRAASERNDQKGKLELDATHAGSLPGIRCALCGETWAMTGVAYPTVTAANSWNGDLKVINADEYSVLVESISGVFGDRRIFPGTQFGPLVGKIHGIPTDFTWLNPWTPLLTIEAAATLEASLDFKIRSEAARLTSISGLKTQLLEPEIEVSAHAAVEDQLPPCPKCGRIVGSVPEIA